MGKKTPPNKPNKKDCCKSGLPSVSVVTVVCNDVENIEKTLLSVIEQDYPNLEYIVIDGGSTDGTVNVIKKYESRIDYWISEKDSGIYDAMNKGIDRASGDWINFMNSNDMFYKKTTLMDVFKNSPTDVDFIYGGIILRHGDEDEYIGTHRPLHEIWKGMPFCHQSLFSKTLLLKQNKFSLKNKISSDYESILFHYLNGSTFFNCSQTIAVVSEFGASGDSLLKFFERWRYARKHLDYKVDIYYVCLIGAVLFTKYCPLQISDFVLEKIFALKPVQKAKNTTTETFVK